MSVEIEKLNNILYGIREKFSEIVEYCENIECELIKFQRELQDIELQDIELKQEVEPETLKRWVMKELDISSILEEGTFPEFILNNKIKYFANENDKRDCTMILKMDGKYFGFYFDLTGDITQDTMKKYKNEYDYL
jgi:hypothetical protein